MTSPVTDTLSPTEQETLKASVFQRLHPRVYLERFLAENIRPDGRSFDAWREVSVNVGSISTANGSALVRVGNTTIVCGVKAELVEPALDREGEGFLVPNVDLPALCSPKFKPGPPGEEAQVLSDRLNEILLASGTVPLDSLCICPGKSAWVLYLDAICINYDGNILDAALLAMVAALKNTLLPSATYNEDTGLTTCSRTVKHPLTLGCMPASFSFGVFDSTTLLFDPTAFEEPLLDTTLSIIVGDDGQLISVCRLGLGLQGSHGAEPTDSLLNTCISAAIARRQSVLATTY